MGISRVFFPNKMHKSKMAYWFDFKVLGNQFCSEICCFDQFASVKKRFPSKVSLKIGISDWKRWSNTIQSCSCYKRIHAFFIFWRYRYVQAFLELSKILKLSLSLNQSSLSELPGFHLNMTLYIMVLRDPTGILSEQETSKLNESNDCNLLKAGYFVSRALIHHFGGGRNMLGLCLASVLLL